MPAPLLPVHAELAWPAETRIRLGSNAVIRRQTLTDAKQDSDLKDTGETRSVVGPPIEGGGLAGRVYASPATAKATDKPAALKAAAVLAGSIGSRVHRWGEAGRIGESAKGEWTSPRMFTRDAKFMNTATVATLDPFFHRVAVPYAASGADHTLILEYQHSATHQGYIASVTDSASVSVKTGSAMYHGKANKKKLTLPGYSTQHAEAEENLLGLTAGSGEAAIDAYTKLAAEGARWVCVRDNMAKLEDTSLFYCADPRVKGGVLTVRFLELWVSWASTFEKKYDIPNSEVVKKLKAGKIGGPDPASEIDPSTDVNLEA